jgi:RNA polymerase sigma-70 factor (ECF subfamily)
MRVEVPMPEAEVNTRRSLISRLRNLEDRDSWQDFFDTYWKLIYSVARKAGLTESEAEEVVQETTATVARCIQDYQYDRKRCSFKNWLLHKTRWRIIDQVRKRPPAFVERFAPATDTSRTPAIFTELVTTNPNET